MNASRLLRGAWRYLVALAALGLLWKLASVWAGAQMLPAPEDAVPHFLAQLGTAAFWGHFRASALRAVTAMALAWALAFPLGVAMGASKRLDAYLAPFIFLTYPIPKIVLLPVFLLLLGLGDTAKIAIIALILGYQVLVTTRDGVRAIHPKYLDSIRSLGGTRMDIAREVLVPAALPHGFTALRLNTGVAVAVLFFVESFATTSGLGYLIMDAWGRMQFEMLFTGILGMSLLGAALYETANGLERRLCAWAHARSNGQ